MASKKQTKQPRKTSTARTATKGGKSAVRKGPAPKLARGKAAGSKHSAAVKRGWETRRRNAKLSDTTGPE